MSVAGILSSLGSLQLGGPSAAKQGLQHLKRDLESGDLNAARSAFAAVQQAFAASAAPSVTAPGTKSAVQASSGSSISQALRQFATGAKTTETTASQAPLGLKQDPTPRTASANSDLSHQAGNLSNTGGASRSGGIAALQTSLLKQIGQALASGDLSSAQQATAQLAYFGPRAQPLNLSGTSASIGSESPISLLA